MKMSERLISLILPENYDQVLQAAKIVPGYKGPRNIGKPNVFLHLKFICHDICWC